MDREHDIFLAPVLTEGDSRTVLRRQCKIGCLLAYFYHFYCLQFFSFRATFLFGLTNFCCLKSHSSRRHAR